MVEEALNGRGGLSRVGTNVTNGSHGVPPLFNPAGPWIEFAADLASEASSRASLLGSSFF